MTESDGVTATANFIQLAARTLGFQSENNNEAGTYNLKIVVSLVDYPSVAPVSVDFVAQLNECILDVLKIPAFSHDEQYTVNDPGFEISVG